MWRNPRYPSPEATPPAENGKRLLTLSRGDGAELRINLAEFQGRPFISIRLWEKNPSGEWWPTKGRGGSIRMGEIQSVIEALEGVVSQQRPEQRPEQRPANRVKVEPVRQFNGRPVPAPDQTNAPWDEFPNRD